MKKNVILMLSLAIWMFCGCSSDDDATKEKEVIETVFVEGVDYNLPSPTRSVSKSNLLEILSEGGWITSALTRVDVDGKQELIFKKEYNSDGTVNAEKTYVSDAMPLGASMPQFKLTGKTTMKCYLYLDHIPANVFDNTTFAYNEDKNELTVNDKNHGKIARHIVLSANEEEIIITSDIMYAKTNKSVYNILTLHHVSTDEVTKWDEMYKTPLGDVK